MLNLKNCKIPKFTTLYITRNRLINTKTRILILLLIVYFMSKAGVDWWSCALGYFPLVQIVCAFPVTELLVLYTISLYHDTLGVVARNTITRASQTLIRIIPSSFKQVIFFRTCWVFIAFLHPWQTGKGELISCLYLYFVIFFAFCAVGSFTSLACLAGIVTLIITCIFRPVISFYTLRNLFAVPIIW